MPDRPPRIQWGTPEERNIDVVHDPGLVTTFGDLVIGAMKAQPDGSWHLTWSVVVKDNRTLPEVELFVAKVGTYILEEPIETWDEWVSRRGPIEDDDDDVPTA